MKDYENIRIELDSAYNYAILYLNRPNQLNALKHELADDLINALTDISNKNSIRTLIITGKGKAFCGGGDLFEFDKAEDPQKYLTILVGKLHEGLTLLKTMKIPSVAAINGACFGAGLGLACSCDLRICSENASFGSAFTRVGLSPDSSTTYHLPKIVGLSLANEMIFLNRILNAEEALKYNLVSRVITSEKPLLDEVKKVAIKLSRGAPIALSSSKKLVNASYSNDLSTHLKLEAEYIRISGGTDDFKEGVNAFLEKRKPNFQGK